MRKLRLIGIVILILMLTGCGKENNAPTNEILVENIIGNENAEIQEQPEKDPGAEYYKTNKEFPNNGTDLQNDYCSIKLYNIKIWEYEDGQFAAVLYFNFANRGDTPRSMGETITPKLFQNTVELETAQDLALEKVPIEINNISKNLNKGDSAECCYAFKLKDEHNPVDAVLYDNVWGYGEIGRTSGIEIYAY